MKEVVDKIIEKRGQLDDALIPILQDIQNEFNYLPEEAIEYLSSKTNISLSKIYGVSTFYNQFKHKPVGKHIIKVCVGTACHVKGAMLVYDSFKRDLKIDENEDTDESGTFTVDKVACLGCCTIAPVVQIDNTTFGNVTPSKTKEIIEEFLSNPEKDNSSTAIKNNDGSDGEIRIGLGSCCMASGSADVKNELEKSLVGSGKNIDVKQVGCVGICNQVPMLEVHKNNEAPYFYTKVKAEEIPKIVRRHFKPDSFFKRIGQSWLSKFEDHVFKDLPMKSRIYDADDNNTPVSEFLDGQINIATQYRGEIKPDDIDEYIRLGGFSALRLVLKSDPDNIISTIIDSGLRGRGGGGFPTGEKWKVVSTAKSDSKYVICNGDEGDPGAFMDRMLLESYPFRIIEGIIISAYAVGAHEGLFYIRAEYPLAVSRIKNALKLCKEHNIIGKNILNSNFDIELKVFEGAGAFICGEETALIASVEGNRGLPKMRPPYPAVSGLWKQPTLINNTETYSLVSWIINNGFEKFVSIGTDGSKGTKVFALAGKINRGGLIEVPIGITIREIVERIGGGIPNGKKFKAVQIGGPSGGCIPASMSDITIDFESLKDAGAMMGSGGLVVLDEDDCMVDIARYFLSFTQDQSCGKCTFCRIGTKRMLDILNKISSGNGTSKDIDLLEELAMSTMNGSLCGLGKTAPNPVLSTLKYFRNEYEEHVKGICMTGKCTNMIKYHIEDSCIGCTKCAQECPVDAIEFTPYKIHVIDNNLCTKCDICRQVCPVDAVITI
jgi:NADH:ubiquinone oxidoreductase subunit F (NADH-binding)/NADH:ubiquinone oxidoreductase subunit E